MYTHLFYCCLSGVSGYKYASVQHSVTEYTERNEQYLLFYCCLCGVSGYKYDRALLRINLAFSTLVWRLQECVILMNVDTQVEQGKNA